MFALQALQSKAKIIVHIRLHTLNLANFKFFVVYCEVMKLSEHFPINQILVVNYYHTLEFICRYKYILEFCNQMFDCKKENGAKINHMI